MKIVIRSAAAIGDGSRVDSGAAPLNPFPDCELWVRKLKQSLRGMLLTDASPPLLVPVQVSY